ncbi:MULTISPECIES: hypothetical protein [Trichocoleus]|uniref:Uncharacterized protein n=1 Tax=Trichocoleus desertorum GB2-A4 TaxID=2933944 RepID=A0ABV0JFS6_9CYAN|nr:hypothetical protein [Trichocoleus sp. FACHB-46]MBD1864545.1 hypothetical protein [Trichocoleus sp. FACHB-46]
MAKAPVLQMIYEKALQFRQAKPEQKQRQAPQNNTSSDKKSTDKQCDRP